MTRCTLFLDYFVTYNLPPLHLTIAKLLNWKLQTKDEDKSSVTTTVLTGTNPKM